MVIGVAMVVCRRSGRRSIRPYRSVTAPPRSRLRDREGRRPPRTSPDCSTPPALTGSNRPSGSATRPPGRHSRRRSRRREPPAPVTGCWRTRRGPPTGFRTPWPGALPPATTRPRPSPRTARPAGHAEAAVRVDGERVARNHHELRRAGRRSRMTPRSTVNRSARITASAPCNASRLSAAAIAARPIWAASIRADSWSALESRRVSPPAANWRAMTDPSPPVPMIAVVMTVSS